MQALLCINQVFSSSPQVPSDMRPFDFRTPRFKSQIQARQIFWKKLTNRRGNSWSSSITVSPCRQCVLYVFRRNVLARKGSIFMGVFSTGLFNLLFGCWHRNLSFPQSPGRRPCKSVAAVETGTYVVCLDCGQEFAYDWQNMRILTGKPEPNSPNLLKIGAQKDSIHPLVR